MRDFDGNKKDNSYLFDGLNIRQIDGKYLAHMGKYPVINLTLKSAKQGDFEMAHTMLCRRIAEEFDRHKYILKRRELLCQILTN